MTAQRPVGCCCTRVVPALDLLSQSGPDGSQDHSQGSPDTRAGFARTRQALFDPVEGWGRSKSERECGCGGRVSATWTCGGTAMVRGAVSAQAKSSAPSRSTARSTTARRHSAGRRSGARCALAVTGSVAGRSAMRDSATGAALRPPPQGRSHSRCGRRPPTRVTVPHAGDHRPARRFAANTFLPPLRRETGREAAGMSAASVAFAEPLVNQLLSRTWRDTVPGQVDAREGHEAEATRHRGHVRRSGVEPLPLSAGP